MWLKVTAAKIKQNLVGISIDKLKKMQLWKFLGIVS
jgi:hypothetical protein